MCNYQQIHATFLTPNRCISVGTREQVELGEFDVIQELDALILVPDVHEILVGVAV